MNELKQLQDIQDEMREGYAPEVVPTLVPVTQRFLGYSSLRWTPITDRMPTVDDANEYHDVEWSDGAERWDNQFYTPNMGNRKATHWRRIVLP